MSKKVGDLTDKTYDLLTGGPGGNKSVSLKQIKGCYDGLYKNLAETEDLEITVPLHNGAVIFVKRFEVQAPNLILAHGLDQDRRRVAVLLSPAGLQIVMTVVNRARKSVVDFGG